MHLEHEEGHKCKVQVARRMRGCLVARCHRRPRFQMRHPLRLAIHRGEGLHSLCPRGRRESLRGPRAQRKERLRFMQAHQTSYRSPIRYLVQERTQVWCSHDAKSGVLGTKARTYALACGFSGRVDWIRTSDPLTPSQVRYQAAPPPVLSCENFLCSARSFFAPQ